MILKDMDFEKSPILNADIESVSLYLNVRAHSLQRLTRWTVPSTAWLTCRTPPCTRFSAEHLSRPICAEGQRPWHPLPRRRGGRVGGGGLLENTFMQVRNKASLY